MSSTDVRRMDGFTSTTHSKPPSAIDPSKVSLPKSYTVCILGASRGIGEGIAYAYALAGASTLILASRSLPALSEVAERLRQLNPAATVDVQKCDIMQNGDVAALAKTISQTHGRLDAVVVNSGFSGPVVTRCTDGDPADFANVTAINYVGTYLAAHHLVPLMLATEGGARAFLAVGSLASAIVAGSIANTAYCISKLAQAKLVEHLSEQYGKEGLLAVSVHPGAVASQMALETAPEAFKQYLVDDPNLCGAFCVRLTQQQGEFGWLGGRLVSANWDVDELVAKRDDVIERDLLKFRAAI